MEIPSLAASSSRILYDVPCVVCRDHSSGKHYGVFACDGCAGFFKRSVRRDRRYACKARAPGACTVDKAHRNQCRACRLAKCLATGMNKDAVQHERGPRNSTIRRQMALFLKDPSVPTTEMLPVPPSIDFSLQKNNLIPPPPPVHTIPFQYYNLFAHPPTTEILRSASPPPITPLVMKPSDSEIICEAAARLLFMNVKWAKHVPVFTSLSLSDRLILLEESWRDLFLIGFAQFLYPIDLKVLMEGKISKINSKDIELFQNTIVELAKIRPDTNEFGFLRAIVLFKTNISDRHGDGSPTQSGGELRRLQDLPAIAALQDHSRQSLNEYTTRMYPMEVSRPSHLLQTLSIVRHVPSNTIVELFFKATIGDTPIERLICDMYRSQKETI